MADAFTASDQDSDSPVISQGYALKPHPRQQGRWGGGSGEVVPPQRSVLLASFQVQSEDRSQESGSGTFPGGKQVGNSARQDFGMATLEF